MGARRSGCVMGRAMTGPLFDSYLMVDWSARATPSPRRASPDAIWHALARRDGPAIRVAPPVYQRSRAAAVAAIAESLAAESDAGRRVLAGFDFPFGYPAGVAARIAGRASALALWDWLADAIEDGPDNANNRFAVAARINRLYEGLGPFWGRPAGCVLADLPARGRARHGSDHPPERRLTDRRLPRAQPVWKLYTTGSVGSQVLLGLPALVRLRRDPRLGPRTRVWPFETGLARPDAQVVLAEIYPSMLAPDPAETIRDAGQVRAVVGALAALDAAGDLAALFAGPSDLSAAERRAVATEEAWILGAGQSLAARRAA